MITEENRGQPESRLVGRSKLRPPGSSHDSEHYSQTDTRNTLPAGRGTPRFVKRHEQKQKQSRKLNNLLKLCVFSLLFAVAIAAGAYISMSDFYVVETKLLYVAAAEKQGPRSLDKEIQVLRDPNIALMTAKNVCGGNSRPADLRSDWEMEAAAYLNSDTRLQNHATKMSAPEFVRWLKSSLLIEGSSSGDSAAVSLRMTGENPEFLKTVLNEYVRCYGDYRRSVAYDIPPAQKNNAECNPVTDSINEQLSKIDLQQRECELSLRLIEARKGVFSGFIPDSAVNIPSLVFFQRKIVELEIAKRALSVRFTAASREIRNVDSEIGEIKNAMRDCLNEHLFFLRKNKEILLAQKQELENKAGVSGKCNNGKCSGKLPNGDAWFYVSNGLQVVQEEPNLVRKPIFIKAEEYKNSLSAFLFLPFNSAEGAIEDDPVSVSQARQVSSAKSETPGADMNDPGN
jgi:hypothetical protein